MLVIKKVDPKTLRSIVLFSASVTNIDDQILHGRCIVKKVICEQWLHFISISGGGDLELQGLESPSLEIPESCETQNSLFALLD